MSAFVYLGLFMAGIMAFAWVIAREETKTTQIETLGNEFVIYDLDTGTVIGTNVIVVPHETVLDDSGGYSATVRAYRAAMPLLVETSRVEARRSA